MLFVTFFQIILDAVSEAAPLRSTQLVNPNFTSFICFAACDFTDLLVGQISDLRFIGNFIIEFPHISTVSVPNGISVVINIFSDLSDKDMNSVFPFSYDKNFFSVVRFCGFVVFTGNIVFVTDL